MSSDERPESLASQAASWVPPWERPQPDLDRDYQATAEAAARASATDDNEEPDDDEERSSAGLSDVVAHLYQYWQPGMAPPAFELSQAVQRV